MDILIGDDLDLQVLNGDFVAADAESQNQILLIKNNTGSFKEFPLVGVGIDKYIKSSGKEDDIKRLVTIQLVSDGYRVNKILIDSNFNIYIDATRV